MKFKPPQLPSSPTPEQWRWWKDCFSKGLDINEITEDEHKLTFLISHVGSDFFAILEHAPSYNEAISILDKHFKKPTRIIYARLSSSHAVRNRMSLFRISSIDWKFYCKSANAKPSIFRSINSSWFGTPSSRAWNRISFACDFWSKRTEMQLWRIAFHLQALLNCHQTTTEVFVELKDWTRLCHLRRRHQSCAPQVDRQLVLSMKEDKFEINASFVDFVAIRDETAQLGTTVVINAKRKDIGRLLVGASWQ